MEFGKLPSLDGVDFTLPPDPPENELVLNGRTPATPPRIYLGATGYNMKPWVGHWYPAGAKERDFVRFYGQQFNTIEHNTTHYRIPDTATVGRWREEVPADFRYCPKVPQSLSHARDLGVHSPELPLFCDMIAGLEDRLGCCFLQVSPYFSPQNLPVLERFLDKWPREIPLAVEVRHEDFFRPTAAAGRYFALLSAAGAAAVITDVAGRRDVCHMHLTNALTMVRFVGNGLHPSDYARIDEWAQRLSAWFEKGLQAAYFFTHEPDNLLAPELAAYAAGRFREAIPGLETRGPKPPVPPAQQTSLFDI
ncbi:MAG: DUF72 domain-containing protein [Saprospiraceae bacterium]|nr:DUF72 domain-containing protein [Saprospiraceae bacterium]